MASRYGEGEKPQVPDKGPNWGKVFGVVLSIILAVVVVGGAAVLYFGNRLISLTNYVADQDVQRVESNEELPSEAMETVSTEESKGEILSDEQLAALHKKMQEASQNTKVTSDDDVFNFMLVGVDRRDKTWNGNSDSMMLVSINSTDKRISIISLMRDTYVDIPEVGYAKLNNSYARGGGPLLLETVRNNYNIDVDSYAAVDFENMIKIIDALGGVDLELTAKECQVANGYAQDMCNTLGLDFTKSQLRIEDGVQHCDGVAAVAYARNRYVGNSDYARTERQRYVMSKIIEAAKNMDPAQMTSFVTQVLPLITTNFTNGEVWDLVGEAPDLLSYEFVTDRVPYDNMYQVIYVDSQDMLVPDWEATIDQLHETIYGDGKASDNYDNDSSDRLEQNKEFADDFESDIINGGAEEETPYTGPQVEVNG